MHTLNKIDVAFIVNIVNIIFMSIKIKISCLCKEMFVLLLIEQYIEYEFFWKIGQER